MHNEHRLTSYRQALHSAWGYNDYNDWPIKVNSVMHLFFEDFAREFLADLADLRARRIPLGRIAKEFGNPARLFRIIDPVIYGMKHMCLDLALQREIVLFLLDMVKSMKFGSEFNEEKKNKILSPHELNSAIKNRDFKPADKSTSEMLHRFCGIMWAYTEAIFFRAHDVTKEIHGPYLLPGICENLLVREYLHLQPEEIWGEISSFPYQIIKIYTEYSPRLKVQIDSYNHLFHEDGNYVQDLNFYALESDGKPLDVADLGALIQIMLRTIEAIHDWVSRVDWRTIVQKYADIYWYRKRPLRDLLGLDWRVPALVRQRIQTGNVNEKRLRNLTKEEIERLISLVI